MGREEKGLKAGRDVAVMCWCSWVVDWGWSENADAVDEMWVASRGVV